MTFLRRKNPGPDPVLSAIDNLMTFSAQALEVNREEARVSADRLTMLEELVAAYGAALDAEKAANASTADRLDLIEQKLVSMGNELSNQLHEMGNEIESLGQNLGDGASAGAIETLRTTQTKLAQEQARYEIAFRQDLAALADQLRRSR